MVAPLLIAAGMQAVGQIANGITGLSAARARRKALNAQADQRLREGGIAAQVGLAEDERAIARAATQAAAGGGGFGGSALNVLDDLARQQTFRARNTIYGASSEASSLQTEGNQGVANAKRALVGSFFGAAGSMFSGMAEAADNKASAGMRSKQTAGKVVH